MLTDSFFFNGSKAIEHVLLETTIKKRDSYLSPLSLCFVRLSSSHLFPLTSTAYSLDCLVSYRFKKKWLRYNDLICLTIWQSVWWMCRLIPLSLLLILSSIFFAVVFIYSCSVVCGTVLVVFGMILQLLWHLIYWQISCERVFMCAFVQANTKKKKTTHSETIQRIEIPFTAISPTRAQF